VATRAHTASTNKPAGARHIKKHAPQRRHHRSDLLRLAKQAMTDHDLQSEFGASIEEQVAGLHEAARETGPPGTATMRLFDELFDASSQR
jgi:hypothetical protein